MSIMLDETSDTQRTFQVGLSAQSGIFFPKDDTLTLRNFPSEVGLITLEFRVNRFLPEAFTHTVRFGLWIDVRGPAPSLDAAIETFGNVARGMAAILSLTANAAIEDPTADVAIETTPGGEIREFWSRDGPSYDWPRGFGRGIPTQLPQFVADAWFQQPEKDRERLFRAIVQYHHAVQNWTPGSEIAALSHIWIGMEAITKLFRDRRQVELELDLTQLKELYATERSAEIGKKVEFANPNALDGEIRRRHFFQGDDAVYKLAKAASNAYEHSFSPLWEVREQAVKAVEPAGTYLRVAIFDLLGLDDKVKALLLSPQFERPYNGWMDTSLHGVLSGPSTAVESIEGYPEIEIYNEHFQLGVDSEEDAAIGQRTRIAASNLPPGVSFKPSSMSITASPSITEDMGLLTNTSEAELMKSGTTAWQETTVSGRPVSSIQISDLLGDPIHTEWRSGISFDPSLEYRVETTKMPEKGVDRADLLRSAERVRQERVLEGWEPVCALAGPEKGSVSILYKRDLPQN